MQLRPWKILLYKADIAVSRLLFLFAVPIGDFCAAFGRHFRQSALADQSEAVFGIHEKTNRVTIKIIDKKTKEVIKEFPPEKTLDMIAKVWEMAGLMVDEKR